MAYAVALQTHHIGIRMTLGAQQDDVLRMVLTQGSEIDFNGYRFGN